ncbi:MULTISPECIES: hypothetical protein [unclassified Sphingobacterium]|uniref:hypothetical protein n=1 Tax=unclassified Sphingobacterium TaxID=2609468 RepID=UPI001FB31B92|nr:MULTISPECIES: hypothetical protein [unclassified Sphingobacterium]MCS3555754.1 hypothetical protein [Sphingobacterium sp. JUb21]
MMKNILFGLLVLISVVACTNKDYFEDTGTHDPKFNGNMMAYLDAKSQRPEDPFDTLTQVIRYAGMEDIFKNEQITFFAPPDPTFRKAIDGLNTYLYQLGKDTITSFKQVKPVVWKKILSQYLIKGDYGLIDFRQVDTTALYAFGGQIFQSYDETESINVGVVYHDLKNGDATIKYGGARQILLSYVPDYSTPSSDWVNTFVSSSNIKPTNGRVHVLNYNRHRFGFVYSRFIVMAIEHGIDYTK